MQKVLLYIGEECLSKFRTGVGQYHIHILNSLNYPFDLVVTKSNIEKRICNNCNYLYISKFKKKIISFFKFFLPVELFFRNYDTIITDSFSFYSIKKRIKLITIIHDCMSKTEPNNYSLRQRFFARISSITYKRASYIIAVSETTKQTIHALYGISYNKIKVIPNITNFKIDKSVCDKFIFIGDMRKTKNLSNLILGYEKYLKNSGEKYKLVIAGKHANEYKLLKKIVVEKNMDNDVEFPGYISEFDKRKLFSEAKGFVFLSDNEGFGIPLLEAVVNKIPVLCSDIPIFREILSDSMAIFVDNKDLEKIANGLRELSVKKIDTVDASFLENKYSLKLFSSKINNLVYEDE